MLEKWREQVLTNTSHDLSGEPGFNNCGLLGYREECDFCLSVS